MDLDGLDACNVCFDAYDETVRPRSIPCGHSICTSCIQNGIKDNRFVCPLCQKSHQVSRAIDLPISYLTEALICRFREVQHGAIPKHDSNTDRNPEGRSVKNRAQEVLIDQTNSLRSLIIRYEVTQSEVRKYKDFLNERKSEHNDISKKIMNMLHQNEEIIKQIESEDNQLNEDLKNGKELLKKSRSDLSLAEKFLKNGKELLKKSRSDLSLAEKLTEFNDVVSKSEDIEKVHSELENWIERCNNQLPSTSTISSSEKIVGAVTTAVNMFSNEKIVQCVTAVNKRESELTITKKLARIRFCSLQNNSALAKHSLERGHLFAIQERKGQVRCADITMINGKTYMHYLKDSKAPVQDHSLLHSDLIKTLNMNSVEVFMDLEWGGSVKGRIHILLSPGTPLARHFRTLCTGDLGPSYAHTRFFEIRDKGDSQSERIVGGDYEKNDGTSGAPLFKGLQNDGQIYKRMNSAGAVGGGSYGNDNSKSGQFRIVVGTGTGQIAHVLFGQVIDGLEVVRAAARLANFRSAIVADCGVVLPH